MDMDAKSYERGMKVEPFLEDNLSNYYFRKKYQRYDPLPGIVPTVKSIPRNIHVVVGTTKKCPYCIATVPMMVRIYLDAENSNISMRVFDKTKGYLPTDFNGCTMPQFRIYDESFDLLFSLDDTTIKQTFEQTLMEKLNALV